jgi:hypothetical protein
MSDDGLLVEDLQNGHWTDSSLKLITAARIIIIIPNRKVLCNTKLCQVCVRFSDVSLIYPNTDCNALSSDGIKTISITTKNNGGNQIQLRFRKNSVPSWPENLR